MQGIIGHADSSSSKRIYNCLLYPIKTENPILSFLIRNFLISDFRKEKNSVTSLMTDIAMFHCFLILFARESSYEKKQKQAKMWFYGKTFSYKAGVLF